MADILRNMDPAYRAFLAIGIAVFLKVLIANWWERFKAREARKPAQLQLRNGVYQEWGVVQRVQRWMSIGGWIWLAYIAALLVLLAWHKLVHPIL